PVWTFTPSAVSLRATTSLGMQGAEQDLNIFRIQARGLLPGVTLINQATIQTFQQRSLVRDQAIYGQEEVLALDERLFVSAGVRADRSRDRKSTRLNSSHVSISYAVFCLKKKKKPNKITLQKI